jgi:Domain of unknown function (DUF4252)
MKPAGILIAAMLLAGTAAAQQIKWNYEKLAAKASDTVDVNLDGAVLRFATKFLSDDNQDEAQAKKLIAGLKGIYVKSFEFSSPGEYSQADLDALRARVRGPDWQRIVGTHSNKEGEDVEVYVKNEGKGIGGLAIIAAEPKELTLVNIVGNIDLDQLSALGGHLGIPEVEVQKGEKKK